MSRSGTPARPASSRPSVAVVPATSPLFGSLLPMIGLDVSTATRSVPVGASCAFASGEGVTGACAQAASRQAAPAIFERDFIRAILILILRRMKPTPPSDKASYDPR